MQWKRRYVVRPPEPDDPVLADLLIRGRSRHVFVRLIETDARLASPAAEVQPPRRWLLTRAVWEPSAGRRPTRRNRSAATLVTFRHLQSADHHPLGKAADRSAELILSRVSLSLSLAYTRAGFKTVTRAVLARPRPAGTDHPRLLPVRHRYISSRLRRSSVLRSPFIRSLFCSPFSASLFSFFHFSFLFIF